MAQITWPRNGREPLCRSGVAAGALLVGLVSSVVTGETLLKNSCELRVDSGSGERWRSGYVPFPSLELAVCSQLATRHSISITLAAPSTCRRTVPGCRSFAPGRPAYRQKRSSHHG